MGSTGKVEKKTAKTPSKKRKQSHSSKHRDESPSRHKKSQNKNGKSRQSDKKAKSTKSETEYELIAIRPADKGVVISPASVAPDRSRILRFTGLKYDIVGDGLDYDPELINSELFEVRKKDCSEVILSFDFSAVDLASDRWWNLLPEDDSESSCDEGDGDYEPEKSTPEEFERRLAKDAAGKKFNMAFIRRGGWVFEVHCKRIKVTEDQLSAEEYAALEKYGHKKVVFLLKSVDVDLTNKWVDSEEEDESDDSGSYSD
jgi:hypothetical protein